MQLQDHWNQIYSQKENPELGWYESDGQVTIDFLGNLLTTQQVIVLPGAGTSTLVPTLVQQGHKLILNDLSDAALEKLKSELNSAQNSIEYVVNDLGLALNDWTFNKSSLWIDRAVLHFLTQTEQIKNYFDRLKDSVQKDGFIMLAEFTYGGAEKCAALPIKQWNVSEMQDQLGEEFKLVKSMNYTFVNPRGEDRLYVYGLFKRISQN
jgi:hypothetical protein